MCAGFVAVCVSVCFVRFACFCLVFAPIHENSLRFLYGFLVVPLSACKSVLFCEVLVL